MRYNTFERVRVTLDEAEYAALLRLSDSELRGVSDQARHIVRRELERLGLLASVLLPVAGEANAPLECPPALRRTLQAAERPEAGK